MAAGKLAFGFWQRVFYLLCQGGFLSLDQISLMHCRPNKDSIGYFSRFFCHEATKHRLRVER